MSKHLHLLSALKIKKIYWVDDENARTEDLDLGRLVTVLAEKLASNTSLDHLNSSLTVLTVLGSKVTRAAAKAIREAFEQSNQEDPLEKISDALDRMLRDFPIENDPKAVVQEMLSNLPQPFSHSEKHAVASAFDGEGAWEWHPISFTQWAQEHSTILSDHNNPENTALLIVDLQNDFESSPINGHDVLANWADWVTNYGSTRSVFAIAFTSHYKPDDEIREGRRFTKELFRTTPPKQLPVLVLSKTRLQPIGVDDDAVFLATCDAFKSALGRLRACLLHWDLAEDVQKVFADSVDSAFKTLQELSIEELLMAVSGSHTHKEGASDIDTLVRMAAIAQRAALLTRIAEDDNITGILAELRGLSEVFEGFKRGSLDDMTGIASLRASEVHDPGPVVNGLFSPLATGDIFEVIRSGQVEYHMLASNICDLTLRGNTGRRKLESGILLRLMEEAGNDEASKSVPDFPNSSPLAGKRWSVKYNLISIAHMAVLDLCWTNKDGNCEWKRSAKDHARLAPSQQRRLAAILKAFNSDEQRALILQCLPGVLHTLKALPEEGTDSFSIKFGIRRVGRISQQFAHSISEGFGRNIGRHPIDHDISGG
jgi:hypothetical protein